MGAASMYSIPLGARIYIFEKKKISNVRMLYFKIQPGPVAKNAPLRPPAANRIRDSVNLV